MNAKKTYEIPRNVKEGKIKGIFDIDKALFKTEHYKFSIEKQLWRKKENWWLKSAFTEFKKKLVLVHMICVDNKLKITPTRFHFLTRIPKSWKEILSVSGVDADKKMEMIEFYLTYIKLKWEDEMLKTPQGLQTLFTRWYGNDVEAEGKNITINLAHNYKLENDNSLTIKNDAENLNVDKLLGIKNGND